MSSQSITLAFRKHGHLYSVPFPCKQGLDILADPVFIDNLDDMLGSWMNPGQKDPFGPTDAGMVLIDVDQKTIYTLQEEKVFNYLLLEKGLADIKTQKFQRLWQDGRIEAVCFNYKTHPLTKEETFALFEEKLNCLFLQQNANTDYALVFQIGPPPGWTWQNFDEDVDSGLALFKQLVKKGFAFEDPDYKKWDDFFFPYTLSSRSVHAQMDREEIELETVSASPLRKMPRL